MNRYDTITLELLGAFSAFDFRNPASFKQVATGFFDDPEVTQVLAPSYLPDRVHAFVGLVLEAITQPTLHESHRWRIQRVCKSQQSTYQLEAAIREHYGRLEHHIDRAYEWNPNKQGPMTLMPGATFQNLLGYLSCSSAFGPNFSQTTRELKQILTPTTQENQATFNGTLPLTLDDAQPIYCEITVTNGTPLKDTGIPRKIADIGKTVHAHVYSRCDKPQEAYRF